MPDTPHRVLRRADLPAYTGLRRTAIADLIARGEFPAPIRVSTRAVAWIVDDVVAWQAARIADRDRKTTT
jgi:prophage regulatory protein